jgi:hypothetical protein
MQLKRWESPRKEGRNDKGRGGSARKRQLKKQRQMLRQRLKEASKPDENKNNRAREDKGIFPLFLGFFFKQKIKNYEVFMNINLQKDCGRLFQD